MSGNGVARLPRQSERFRNVPRDLMACERVQCLHARAHYCYLMLWHDQPANEVGIFELDRKRFETQLYEVQQPFDYELDVLGIEARTDAPDTGAVDETLETLVQAGLIERDAVLPDVVRVCAHFESYRPGSIKAFRNFLHWFNSAPACALRTRHLAALRFYAEQWGKSFVTALDRKVTALGISDMHAQLSLFPFTPLPIADGDQRRRSHAPGHVADVLQGRFGKQPK